MTSFRLALSGALFAMVLAPAALVAQAHDGVAVDDAYARFMPGGKAGAVFMTIENHATTDDRLIGAASEIAEKVELHTHEASADGTMKMRAVEGGIAIPAGGVHELARGGDHIMFMGLKSQPEEGGTVPLTLTFEHAGEVTIEVPVDNKR